MQLYVSIGPITFDYGMFVSFLIGVSFGFLFLLLIYLYAVLKSLNKNLKLRKTDEQDIDEEEIKWLINDAKKLFKDKKERDKVGYPKHLMIICKELSVDIAKKFFPKSKYPYLELTIDETLVLNHYITNRIEELFKSRMLKMFRGWTIAKIVEANEVKVNIENTALVKTAKKYKVAEVAKTTVAALNVMNPMYWLRKITVKISVDIVMVKIGMAIIAITGEETYKIYSKKVFDEEKEIDAGFDDIYKEIASEMKKVSENNEETS
jgi:hypothetical protein